MLNNYSNILGGILLIISFFKTHKVADERTPIPNLKDKNRLHYQYQDAGQKDVFSLLDLTTINDKLLESKQVENHIRTEHDSCSIESLVDFNFLLLDEEVEEEVIKIPLSREYSKTIKKQFFLYQNNPEPFSKETVVRFDLTEPSIVSFSVYDEGGRVLQELTKEFDKGTNMIRLNGTKITYSQLLYYQLATNEQVEVRTMHFIGND